MADDAFGPAPETRGHTIRRWARGYDWLVTIMSLGRRDRLGESVVSHAELQPGTRGLDVGCGIGVLTLHLQRTVGETGHVSGIDASPEMITLAQGKARKRGAPIDFRLGVAEALPFDAATFDRVTSTLVSHHLPDDVKQASLREIQRVLIPGGRVVVADFARRGRLRARQRAAPPSGPRSDSGAPRSEPRALPWACAPVPRADAGSLVPRRGALAVGTPTR